MGKVVPQEKREEILKLIKEEGCTIREASQLGEVSEKTIRGWIKRKTNNAHSSTSELQKIKKENTFLKEILVGMLLEKESAKKNSGSG